KHFCEVCKASHIAARMGEAGHQSKAHRVCPCGHDDWDRARCLSCREVGRKRSGKDHTWIEAHQFVRQIRQADQITIGERNLKSAVAGFDISELTHALSKACQIALKRLRGSGAENTDDRHARLLCVSLHRPSHCRTGDEQDELAPPHSITSSAATSSLGGTVRPSTFAVMRLTTRSNLIGCSTGISPGFAPCRILATRSAARLY